MSETANKEAASEKEKKKSSNGLIIVVIVLLVIILLVLVGVVAFLLGRDKGRSEESENRRQVQSSVRTIQDENDAANVVQQMKEEVAEGYFECKMSMAWTFPDGESESPDAYIANSENNSHPIIFDIYLTDTEELLYSSPVLPVGSDIKNLKLDKALPAGTYNATVMYSLIEDETSQKVISSAGFIVTITVLN
jgi:type II secretory pathway pseudopilin PulG